MQHGCQGNAKVFIWESQFRSGTPTIEIYQNSTEVNVLGKTPSQYKSYEFSLVICSNHELDSKIQPEFLDGLSHFDLKMLLKQKDDTFIPFELAGLAKFTIEAYAKWVFDVNNYEITQKLIAL